MNISVFEKYKVKLHNKYSYISDYDYEVKDPIFSEDEEPVGEIVIEKFESQDGTGGTITISYKAIK